MGAYLVTGVQSMLAWLHTTIKYYILSVKLLLVRQIEPVWTEAQDNKCFQDNTWNPIHQVETIHCNVYR